MISPAVIAETSGMTAGDRAHLIRGRARDLDVAMAVVVGAEGVVEFRNLPPGDQVDVPLVALRLEDGLWHRDRRLAVIVDREGDQWEEPAA